MAAPPAPGTAFASIFCLPAGVRWAIQPRSSACCACLSVPFAALLFALQLCFSPRARDQQRTDGGRPDCVAINAEQGQGGFAFETELFKVLLLWLAFARLSGWPCYVRAAT